MTKHDQPPSTDRAEIEALISRGESGQLHEVDARLIGRLWRLLLKPINTNLMEYGDEAQETW